MSGGAKKNGTEFRAEGLPCGVKGGMRVRGTVQVCRAGRAISFSKYPG